MQLLAAAAGLPTCGLWEALGGERRLAAARGGAGKQLATADGQPQPTGGGVGRRRRPAAASDKGWKKLGRGADGGGCARAGGSDVGRWGMATGGGGPLPQALTATAGIIPEDGRQTSGRFGGCWCRQ